MTQKSHYRHNPAEVCRNCGGKFGEHNYAIHRKEKEKWRPYHARCLSLVYEAARPK